MKSIYSLQILQRILDHWGVGLIEDVTYFHGPGRNIWRHHIDTNQGVFEMYSYPVSEKEYAEPTLNEYMQSGYPFSDEYYPNKQIVHSFDRYHILLQMSKKHKINKNQACKDLDLLIGSRITEAFRGYGAALYMYLDQDQHDDQNDTNKSTVLVSYDWWSIQNYEKGRANVIADSKMHEYEKLDLAIKELNTAKPIIEKYVLKGSWFELYLSNRTSLHFNESLFPAMEVHLKSRKNSLLIFTEHELYYSRNLRE